MANIASMRGPLLAATYSRFSDHQATQSLRGNGPELDAHYAADRGATDMRRPWLHRVHERKHRIGIVPYALVARRLVRVAMLPGMSQAMQRNWPANSAIAGSNS